MQKQKVSTLTTVLRVLVIAVCVLNIVLATVNHRQYNTILPTTVIVLTIWQMTHPRKDAEEKPQD